MESKDKCFAKGFGLAMLFYTVAVPASIWLLQHHGGSPWKTAFALLPVVPAAGALLSATRWFRGLDELQRRIQYEGLSFSFLATSLTVLTWGFLQNADVPHFDVIWVAPLQIALWWFGTLLATRKYR